MKTATVYPTEGIGAIISPSSSGGYYHIYAIKKRTSERLIDRTPLTVGYMTFIPGEWYSRFGSNKKTSATFIRYDGAPIQFIGTYLDNALFVREIGPFEYEEFELCYYSWHFSREHRTLIGVTHSSAARVMEMDAPPNGPSLFNKE